MNGATQYSLPLDNAASADGAEYIVSSCNQDAYQSLIERNNTMQHHATLLIGEALSGKSTLATLWQEQHKAITLSALTLAPDLPTIAKNYYVLDDCELCDESELFHLLNQAKSMQSSLLLTASKSASLLPFTLPDLTSRLRALPVVKILQPDDAMMTYRVQRHLQRHGVSIQQHALYYLIPRLPRSYHSINTICDELIALVEQEKRTVTVPLIRQLLQEKSL